MDKQEEKAELIKRVRKVKKFLKIKGIQKQEFVDGTYGAMYDSEHSRITNLWSCKIVDVKFTEQLEHFAEFQKSNIKDSAEFERFMNFQKWFLALGGEPLTVEQIENCYPKFNY